MNFNSNISDEEVYSSVSLDLSALEKLDEITQRLTMDALNAPDTAISHPQASTSGEHSEHVSTRKKRSSVDPSIFITDEETKYRLKLYPEPSKVLKDKIRCTACGKSLQKHVEKGHGLYFHPLLQVIVCQDCREFYGDGDFPLDDDNSDTYCRWCAQGGSLYCCSACSFIFCKSCIRRNFKKSMLEEIEEKDWKCFACNPEALWKHRAVCWAAREYVDKHPRVENNSETSDDEPQIRRRPKERKDNVKGKDSTQKKTKSSARASLKDENETRKDEDDINGKKKSRRKREKESDEEVKEKHKHAKEKTKEKEKREEKSLDISLNKSGEEVVVRDKPESGDGVHAVEGCKDDISRQILTMRKTCMLLEGLTKDTQNITQSVTKKANQLHVWISGKNRTSHKEFPTSPIKLGKMIASFKKILLGLRVNTEELQNKVVEAEEEWTNNGDRGEKVKENVENSVQEEEGKGNGEVGLKRGEEEKERPVEGEKVDKESGMQEEEEGENESYRVNGVQDGSELTLMNGLNTTLDIEDMESEEIRPEIDQEEEKAEENNASETCNNGDLSNVEALIVNGIGKGLEDDNSGEKIESKAEGERHEGGVMANQKLNIDSSDDKLNEGDMEMGEKGDIMESERVEEKEVAKEKDGGDERAEDESLNIGGDEQMLQVAEREDEVRKNNLSIKGLSENLAGFDKTEISFDLFEDEEQSPFNIPIPLSDSEEENEGISEEKGVRNGEVASANSKEDEKAEDEKEVERGEVQSPPEKENSSKRNETLDKANIENDAGDRSNTLGSSAANEEHDERMDKLVLKVKKEPDNKIEENSEKIKPTKDDQNAKLEFLLNSSSSSDENDNEPRRVKKRHTKKKSKHSEDSSDSDSDSPEQKTVKRKDTCSESLSERVPDSKLISQFDDEKLRVGCSVRLNKLDKCDPETSEPKKAKTVSKEDSIEKAIKRLGNLKTLDKPASSRKNSDDDSDEDTKNKPKIKKKPSEKKSSDNDLKVSSDEAPQISSDEKESMDKLNEFPEKMDTEMDALAKKMLFESSASDSDLSDEEDKEDVKKKKNAEKPSAGIKDEKDIKKDKDENGSSSDDFDTKRSKKSRHKDKLLTEKLSETDSSEEEKKWQEKKEKEKKSQRKKLRRRLASSSSDDVKISSENSSGDSSSSEEIIKKRKRAPKSDSSEDKSSGSKTKKKLKRRRIKTVDTDSDSKGDCDDDDKNDTPNKGRKNIRKVLKGDRLGEETKQAAKHEEERMKRIAERQKLYNDIFTDSRNLKVLDKLVLDFDPETKKELVYVDPNLVKKLKPHQAEGVKFMWDACFESLKRMKTEKGSGCILAHCMGLGKTLQVITLVHTLLSNPKTKIQTVLVICPLNTVLNWVNEFKIWLKDLGSGKDVEVFEISKYKVNVERMHQLKDWQADGGVMVIGYDMYRNLVNTGRRIRKKVQEVFQSALVDPGPDLVICDEGHLLKNTASALAKAVNAMKTARRIVLTGTPLQNNLKEYHCMIQFVKPSLLGTHKEFLNRFVNPISNGQCADSTPHDVRVMKRRAHVLHKMLEGCVQRCDYSVLTPFLPPKHEYVVCIRLTELQSKLYVHYLENFAQKAAGGGASLFNDFQNLQRIWTHPRVLKMSTERNEKKKLLQSEDSEGSLKDFIDDDSDESDTTESSESNASKTRKRKKIKRSCKKKGSSSSSESSDVICLSDENKDKNSKDNGTKEDELLPPEQKAWWEAFVEEEDHDKLIHSGKLTLLLDILQKCELIGDKVLLFSQSLFSLDLIEYFLEKIDEKTQSQTHEQSTEEAGNEELKFNFVGSWVKGLDYFRIDGSVSGENRNIWCKSFNREDNLRARLFLISTRAGGMGINLVGANRVILFDASWNPSSDLQSIFRIYRFGQKKPCYVYRFLAQGTMEEKIYNRQVTKLSLASRVLDEHQIERHFNFEDLQDLYKYEPAVKSKTPMLPKDRLLAELIQKYSDFIDNYHEHDSLLENKAEEELTEDERKAAWEDFENEKKEKLPDNLLMGAGVIGMQNQMFAGQITEAIPGLMEAILQKHPNATEEQLSYELRLATSRLNQYFNRVSLQQQQQMFNMASQNQIRGNAPIYPTMRQPVPQQAALMQAHYGLQNYYHSPVHPSSSSGQMMLPMQVQNKPNHFVPGAMSSMQQQLLLQQQNAHSNMLPTIQNSAEGNAAHPVKLKIRQDLMPSASDDNDIIIESVKRRE